MSEQENQSQTQTATQTESNPSPSRADEAASNTTTTVDSTPDSTATATFDKALEEASKPTVRAPEELQPEVELPAPSFDDFNALKVGDNFLPSPKKEVAKVDAAKVKPDITTEVKVEPKKEVTKTDGTKVVARDYTGFDEKETEVLKKMSNESFNYIRPALLERKNLAATLAAKDKEIADLKVGKTILPDNYFEHPKAYVLTPEYNAAASNLNIANFALTHWQQQLVNIRQGQPWKDIELKDGRPVYGVEQKADAQAEAKVLHYINYASNQLSRVQNDVQQIEQSWDARHKQASGVFKEAEKQHFSDFENADHPYMPVVKNILNSIPVEFKSNPMTTLLAKSGARTIQAMNYAKQVELENIKLKEKVEALEKNGAKDLRKTPTEGDINAAGSKTNRTDNGKEVTMADFAALKY